MRPIGNAIQQGFAQPRIRKHLRPFGKWQVGGHDQCRPLGAFCNHLEQELCPDVGQRHVADFIEHDQVITQPSRQHALYRILPPGLPMISGRKAIKQFWSEMIRSANAKSATLESIDVMPAGDGVVEIGRAVLTVEPDGQAAVQIEVKYVVYWQQEQGRWKWHVDIWNPNA